MAELSERLRIEILILLGYGERKRTQAEVCELFNNLHPEYNISQSTVSKIYRKFEETGSVKDLPKLGRIMMTNNEKRLDIMLGAVQNPHVSLRQLAQNNNISKSTVHRIMKKEK